VDNSLIILLALTKGPFSFGELVKTIESSLGEECPWSTPIEVNDFYHDFNEILQGSNYIEIVKDEKYFITREGMKVLKESKVLDFIFTIKNMMMNLAVAKLI